MSELTSSKAALVAQADRITAIVTLRGVALLGILMMNIPYFPYLSVLLMPTMATFTAPIFGRMR